MTKRNLAALAWGFAEATLFFIVPDVLLTWFALRSPRAARAACVWATAGALLGGTVMHSWGASDPGSARAALERLPAIGRASCDAVGAQLRAQGVAAVFLGPIRGTPYKVYAVQAGVLAINLPLFLAVSLPARLIRFLLVTTLAAVLGRCLPGPRLSTLRLAHVMLWTAFYAWYFHAFTALS
jgi:membrane protein YqaA with SNARE-associated domain